MQALSIDRPSACDDIAILYVALELSKSSWLVALNAPGSNKISKHAVTGGDLAGLLALIERARTAAEARLGRPVRAVSCYEAGYDGFWLHRALTGAGIENRVLDPASIPVDRGRRRAKTDNIDVIGLMRVLMALLRGESQVCAVVHPPSMEEEDERHVCRERSQSIKERVRHTNRIKALLMTHGVRGFDPCRANWRAKLEGLRRHDGQPLPPHLAKRLERECVRLHLLLEQIAGIEAQQRRRVAAAALQESGGRAGLLARLRGIGVTSAASLYCEALYRDFKNVRQVGGYLGLAPSPWKSGSLDRDQGIAKSGNPRARTLSIEIAWLWVRHQPGSALTRWFWARVGDAKGRLRRIAIVAMARKLMVALWRYVSAGVVPEGAVFKA